MASFYSENADAFFRQYESLPPRTVNRDWAGFIPGRGARILDIGAGSGRDAAWLAAMGHEVTAVEPARDLRRRAMAAHPDPAIRWVDDRLPDLAAVRALGRDFSLILANAVWMHLPPRPREPALGNMRKLLRAGGTLVITLRHGPSPDERAMHPVHCGELEAMAGALGLAAVHRSDSRDKLGRDAVSWSTLVLSCREKPLPAGERGLDRGTSG